MSQNYKTKKIIALVTVVFIGLVLILSAFYLAEHVDHKCDVHDCPICEAMAQCSNNIKTIGTALAVVAVGIVYFAFLICVEQYNINIFFCNSLISKKVRMDN